MGGGRIRAGLGGHGPAGPGCGSNPLEEGKGTEAWGGVPLGVSLLALYLVKPEAKQRPPRS